MNQILPPELLAALKPVAMPAAAGAYRAFCEARQAMLAAYLAWVPEAPAAQDATDEAASTASAMSQISQLMLRDDQIPF